MQQQQLNNNNNNNYIKRYFGTREKTREQLSDIGIIFKEEKCKKI